MSLFVAIDGGGSKTICLVADDSGQLLGVGSGGPTKPGFVPESLARRSLETALKQAWKPSNEPPLMAAISGPVPRSLGEQVVQEITGARRVVRLGEGEAAWQAVHPWVSLDYGLVVDAGTGSFVSGVNSEGERAGAGGEGPFLGDDGSGHWIGWQAMRAVLRSDDGREPPTMLTPVVCQALGIDKPREMIRRFHWENLSRHEIASLCPLVVQVARQGDVRARAILAAAGRELALMARAVIRKLRMADQEFLVVPFGSVFKAGELVLATFREQVLQTAPQARIVVSPYESVVGALVTAMEQGGIEIARVATLLKESLDNEPLARVQAAD